MILCQKRITFDIFSKCFFFIFIHKIKLKTMINKESETGFPLIDMENNL